VPASSAAGTVEDHYLNTHFQLNREDCSSSCAEVSGLLFAIDRAPPLPGASTALQLQCSASASEVQVQLCGCRGRHEAPSPETPRKVALALSRQP
jgi:hypothetical protein